MKEAWEIQCGYVTRNVGREMREGKTRHNTTNRGARSEDERKDVHSVGILCEKVVPFHIQLVIENNRAIDEIK